jgi:hypothetical protein
VALGKYREHALQDWVNSWKFWIPGHIVSFGFCPPHLRFPWMATVSFGYCCAFPSHPPPCLLQHSARDLGPEPELTPPKSSRGVPPLTNPYLTNSSAKLTGESLKAETKRSA